MAEKEAYLGSGATWPIVIVDGKAEVSVGMELVKQDLLRLFERTPVSRFFIGEFSSRVEQLMFEPNDALFESLATTFISQAMVKWAKRVRLVQPPKGGRPIQFVHKGETIQDGRTGGDQGQTDIIIYIQARQSNEVDSIIFPFFRTVPT